MWKTVLIRFWREINLFRLQNTNQIYKISSMRKKVNIEWNFVLTVNQTEILNSLADPGFIARQNVKERGLDDRLKKVFVTSQEPAVSFF